MCAVIRPQRTVSRAGTFSVSGSLETGTMPLTAFGLMEFADMDYQPKQRRRSRHPASGGNSGDDLRAERRRGRKLPATHLQ